MIPMNYEGVKRLITDISEFVEIAQRLRAKSGASISADAVDNNVRENVAKLTVAVGPVQQ